MKEVRTEEIMKVVAVFDCDKKNFHRFKIEDESDKLVGTLYIRKTDPVPKKIEIELKNKTD